MDVLFCNVIGPLQFNHVAPLSFLFVWLVAVDIFFFFFSSRRRHTRYWRDWSSDVCSSDLDDLLTTNQDYNACRNVIAQAAARAGARLIVAQVPFPLRDADEALATILGAVKIGRASCRERV